jgi:alpha-ketoglutarate-dependent taurine dioxygenase
VTTIEVRPLTPAFGAEVLGVDPSCEWDAGTRAQVREAFDERGLLLLRGTPGAIDQDAQVRLVRMLSEEEDPELDRYYVRDRPSYVSNRDDGALAPYGRLLFHSDMAYVELPQKVLALYAVHLESPVVPTMFASTVHAWDTLSDGLRAQVEGLEAVHATGHRQRERDDDGQLLGLVHDEVLTVTTPVARRHPRTGRTMLYVSQMSTRDIVGLPPADEDALLDALFDHLYRSDALLVHEWREGDLLVWDNIAIQHARANVDTAGPSRRLRKVLSHAPEAYAHSRPGYGVAGQA